MEKKYFYNTYSFLNGGGEMGELTRSFNWASTSIGNGNKHPLALGQKAKDCWLEIWNIISPLIRQVRHTGEATWSEDQLIPIYRNGKLEDV